MGYSHHHHHHADAGDRNLALAVLVNLGLTVVQFIGGLMAGSLALMADALHNLSDAVSLIIAFGARRIARRPANARMTFGYGRAEVVAALVNYSTLILIGLYLVYEAVLRFLDPQPVAGWLVVLAVDLATALLTWNLSKTSVNIRAAFLHNMADALGSVAVIVAGALIILFGWTLADPLITLAIAGYILWMSGAEIGPVIRILMLGSPPGADPERLIDDLRGIDGVAGIHHAHLWQIDEHARTLEAHVVIEAGHWSRADAIKAALKDRLANAHAIHHSTFEMECANHACPTGQTFGHDQRG
jgi:cobalt-zinc-cadmium efflux system protein